ncbi:hypothetical protein RM780_13155 [Streptomyces sp. DSM 44917]|uniref:Uncharacterized protein n=1 Tax=Streptomyces boetiae TaxID=3075541 RepID=A0ABU2L8L9_9ACTN|nr:hypothetical protein [Streptomyces sp. DSM 44917]MDT0307904.1 hypothetical protein [Streptomyces sp. DSM 44917]
MASPRAPAPGRRRETSSAGSRASASSATGQAYVPAKASATREAGSAAAASAGPPSPASRRARTSETRAVPTEVAIWELMFNAVEPAGTSSGGSSRVAAVIAGISVVPTPRPITNGMTAARAGV